MSKFIIAFPLFILFIFFFLQFMTDEVSNYKKNRFNDIVHKYVQTARTYGYFTPQLINGMRTELAQAFFIPESSVTINCTTTPKYRLDKFDQREMIYYEVSVPIDKIIGAPNVIGISASENKMNYVKKGEAASELLAP